MKDFKIRIIQPGVPEYRRGLFEGLGEIYGNRIELWADDTSGMGYACKLTKIKTDYSHKFYNLSRSLRWQRGLTTKGMRKGDVLVICGDLHHLSTIWLAFCAKLRNINVVWWGHHRSATSTLLKIKIRVMFMRMLSSVCLCYTKQGKEFLVKHGVKEKMICYTGNTVDEGKIDLAIKYWNSDRLKNFLIEKGLENKNILLFCSVLRKKTKLDQLFAALKLMSRQDVIIVVIGSGGEEDFFKSEAERLGVGEKVLWIGGVVEQCVLAPWFLSAKAFVYPGPIGLSLIHSFYYKLPVITHSNVLNHGPEFYVMKDNETGFLYEEDNILDLVSKIERILKDDKCRNIMGKCAREIAEKKFSIKNMVKNFSHAIELSHSLSI